MRELLGLGLAGIAVDGNAGTKSSSYGVFRRGPDGHRQEDAEPDVGN